MCSVRKAVNAGFTLVELLIVVIIIAVLAAIIVPQFSSATIDAKEAALDANLARMRAAIELYSAQHALVYPGANTAVPAAGVTCGGTAGTGTAASGQAFIDQLTMYSNSIGATCSVGDATVFKYGPYVRKGVPADSITGKGAAAADFVVQSTGAAITVAAGTTTGGWKIDTKSGQIVMNSAATDSKGNAYSTH